MSGRVEVTASAEMMGTIWGKRRVGARSELGVETVAGAFTVEIFGRKRPFRPILPEYLDSQRNPVTVVDGKGWCWRLVREGWCGRLLREGW